MVTRTRWSPTTGARSPPRWASPPHHLGPPDYLVQVLEALVKDHKLVTYQGMGHEGTMEELEDIKAFILQQLS